MLIILGIYGGVIYLVFGKLKLLPWNGLWKSVSAFVGLIIALVVIGALNYLTPSGGVTVQGATIAITPNVSGTVVEIAVEANKPVSKGDLLFRIDPEPFQTEIDRLQAALVEAQTAANMLQTDLEAIDAEIDGLEVQLTFGQQRRDDIVKLADRGVNSQFQLQEAVSTIGQLDAGLRAARARKQGLELRIASQVDGVDSAVAQVQQLLRSAEWNLQQTEIRAPGDGIVTALTLQAGSRVTMLNSAVAFVPYGNRVLTGVFSQTSAHALQVGVPVMVAMRGQPGKYFETVIVGVFPGTGEGTLPSTGTLPTISQLLGSNSVAVRLKLPDDQPEYLTRLGASGSALVITPEAGPIEPLAKILFWITRYMNYL
jgi:multidrug resistance efflux pump